MIVSKREARVAIIDVVRQTLRDMWAGNAMEWAAALAFYAVLCVFPLVLAGAALAAFVVEPSVVAARLSSLLEGFVPPGVIAVEPIITAAIAARRRVGLFAILVWLVAGRRILGALVTALDRVSDVDERHESLRRRATVEVVLLVGIGTLFVAALSARSLLGLAVGGDLGNRSVISGCLAGRDDRPCAAAGGGVLRPLHGRAVWAAPSARGPCRRHHRDRALPGRTGGLPGDPGPLMGERHTHLWTVSARRVTADVGLGRCLDRALRRVAGLPYQCHADRGEQCAGSGAAPCGPENWSVTRELSQPGENVRWQDIRTHAVAPSQSPGPLATHLPGLLQPRARRVQSLAHSRQRRP